MLPLLFLALPAMAYAQGPPVSCASFWPGAATSEIVDAQCYIYPDSPETVGSVKFTFAYEVAWAQEPDFRTILDSLAALVHTAMQRIVPTYASLQNSVPNAVFILTTLSLAEEQADTSRPLGDAGPCQIKLSSSWWEDPGSREDDKRMQTIAHEMYHCIQSDFFGPTFNAAQWVVESSAEYFSNVVFPAVNDEWAFSAKYHPERAIFDNNPYSGNVFLQSMEQAYGPAFINDWVKQSTSTDGISERTRLSGLDNFPDDFHSFGRQFSSNSIRDTSGVYLPQYPPVVDPVAFAPSDDEETATISLTPTTFTINVYSFDLDAGQTVSISYSSTSSNVRVSYMLEGSGAWLDMPGGNNPVSAEGTIVAQCTDADQTVKSIPVLMLITATDDADTADVEVIITQISQDDNCGCPKSSNKNRRGLARCSKTPPSSNSNLCTPVADQPTSDPCLEGKTWTLDNAAMEALLRSKLASTSSVTIHSLSVSGTGAFTITGTNATFTYTNFSIDLDIEADGFDVPTQTVVNGEFDSNLYLQSSDVFCLDVYAGQGSAVEKDPITGGFSFTLGPDGGFVEQSYRIDYVCSAGSLTMQMNQGSQTFGPYVYSS